MGSSEYDEKVSSGSKPEIGHHVEVSTKEVDTAAALIGDAGEIDPAEAIRIRKKIDRHILPLMVQFMDKTTLGSSAILGITTATHLTTNQWVFLFSPLCITGMKYWLGHESNYLSIVIDVRLGTIFYLSYLVFEYPQNLALQRFPVVWSIALCCHAACTNFAGLFVVRLILGMCEGSITAGFMIVSSMFYTRNEQTLRVGYWFLMNGTAQIISGFLSFGSLHIHTPKFEPWQWLMVITGAITFITAICFFPTNAWFLTPGERALAVIRIKENQTGVENKHFKKEQMIEALLDPKTWMFALFSALDNVPNSLTNQRSLIVSSFGFTYLQTTLLGCVDGVIEIVTIWTGVNIAARFPNSRAYVGFVYFIPNIVGVIVINTLPWSDKVGLLFGQWLTGVGTTGFVLSLSWLSSVTAGHTKRITTNAIMLETTFPGLLLASAMGFSYLHRQNKLREVEPYDDQYDNVYIERLNEDGTIDEIKVEKEFLDLTDKQNRDFRYVLFLVSVRATVRPGLAKFRTRRSLKCQVTKMWVLSNCPHKDLSVEELPKSKNDLVIWTTDDPGFVLAQHSTQFSSLGRTSQNSQDFLIIAVLD
ncbi:MFS general substrate transporter [Lentinula aff. lateritia]|uniref:MFS general substrate transporter n=1 Tax=Lentinula aff. lateritia TaxID=2804960 RepID=A0ACC1TWW0_9AGAR|nr:MFS general substrate transporter [Lentinula aff. lateritia]